MINVFYRNRNTIGQFMVALMFLGTFGFLFTFDGFVSESQASGCCSSGEVQVASFASDSSGDFSGEIPIDVSVQSDIMNKVIPSSSSNNGGPDVCDCGAGCSCKSASDCDGTKTCPNVDSPACCLDDAKYVCECSSYCGGKGPTGCSGSGNCER